MFVPRAKIGGELGSLQTGACPHWQENKAAGLMSMPGALSRKC